MAPLIRWLAVSREASRALLINFAMIVTSPIMNRRTSPSAKRDDDAFPIRVKLAVPPEGLGRRLDEMTAWLRDHLPRDAYAVHSARTIGGSAMAVHFLTIDDAVRFVKAVPHVPLAVPRGGTG